MPTSTKLKYANISYTHIYVRQYRTEPPNLNQPIFLLELILGDPPNLNFLAILYIIILFFLSFLQDWTNRLCCLCLPGQHDV